MGASPPKMSRVAIATIVVLALGAAVHAQSNLCTAAARKEQCPPSAPFFGFMGCAAALVFACLGAAYGTAKSGVGVANMGVLHPEMVMKSIIPVVMAGVLGIYGLIVAVLLASGIKADDAYMYSSYSGFSALSAGLCCGLALPQASPLALLVMLVSAPTPVSPSCSWVLFSFLSLPRLSDFTVSLLPSSSSPTSSSATRAPPSTTSSLTTSLPLTPLASVKPFEDE